MIIFDLRCANDHVFEAWFASSEDYESQRQRGFVACPICDSDEVEKAVMAPAVGTKSNRKPVADSRAELKRLAAFQAKIEENCDYVGRDFAREARARHEEGKAGPDSRGIIGETTPEEAADLLDDGIPILPLPFRSRHNADA